MSRLGSLLQSLHYLSKSPWAMRSYATALRRTEQLPGKINMKVSAPDPSTGPPNLLCQTNGVEQIQMSRNNENNYVLRWTQKPRNVLIVKKPNDQNTEVALIEIASWLHKKHPDVSVIVEPDVAEHFKDQLDFVYVNKGDKSEYCRTVDFAITLGGDGTILHASSLFPTSAPPMISFSLGTLGFLMPFHVQNYRSIIEQLIHGDVPLLLRMRLNCSLRSADGKRIVRNDVEIGDIQVMNEVTIHRGRHPHLTAIDCFVDGQFLTEGVADGLIVATPTGSTAYSLSAGGPIVHPSVQSVLLTPICPRSLSFRTVLLPSTSRIQLRMGEFSRSQAEVSMDGRDIHLLEKGDYLQVERSPFPIPCVNRVDQGVDWARDINDLLKWNQNFESKSQLRHGYMDA